MDYDYQTIYTAVDGRAVAGPWNWTHECVRFHQGIAKSASPKAIAASYINDGPVFTGGDYCPEWHRYATHVVVRWKPHSKANYRMQDQVSMEVK